MGLFSAVIDRSPIDRYGASANANALSQYGATTMQQAREMYDMGSTRNQMFKEQAMQDAFDTQGQQAMLAQRQAARSGQAFTPAGMDTSRAVRAQVQNQWANQMMAQQQQSGSFAAQAANMQSQAGSQRNTMNQLYRQQQQANQQAKMQANSAKLSMFGSVAGGLLGPAIGALGGGIAAPLTGQTFQQGAAGNLGLMQQATKQAPQAGGFLGGLGRGLGQGLGQGMMNYQFSNMIGQHNPLVNNYIGQTLAR
tara:strand:- start:47 stop:802 length:756 start_codon:yes stop_codon:yes gene_type:complete